MCVRGQDASFLWESLEKSPRRAACSHDFTIHRGRSDALEEQNVSAIKGRQWKE